VKILLDTHTVLWWFADDPALPLELHALIDEHRTRQRRFSLEICTKVRIGKLPTGRALCDDFNGFLERFHFMPLPISVGHGRRPHVGGAVVGGRRAAGHQ
jgi:PIN domain nuclease of toxin-antitoxin system